jgi:hypothetical protein
VIIIPSRFLLPQHPDVAAHDLVCHDDCQDDQGLEDRDHLARHVGKCLDAFGTAVEIAKQQRRWNHTERIIAREERHRDAEEAQPLGKIDVKVARASEQIAQADEPGDGPRKEEHGKLDPRHTDAGGFSRERVERGGSGLVTESRSAEPEPHRGPQRKRDHQKPVQRRVAWDRGPQRIEQRCQVRHLR